MGKRIFGYGETGSGKTRAALTCVRHTPGSRAIAIDTDDGITDLLEGPFKDIADRVEVRRAYFTWEDLVEQIDYAVPQDPSKRLLGPNDWLIIDTLDAWYSLAQDYVAKCMFGTTVVEKMKELMKSGSKTALKGFDSDTWVFIRNLHDNYLLRCTLGNESNVFATCASRQVVSHFADSEDKQWGKYRPAGQDKIANRFKHIIRFENNTSSSGDSKFTYSIIKDRINGEPLMKNNIPLVEFYPEWQALIS